MAGKEANAGIPTKFAQFRKNFCVQVGSDPKSGNVYQFLDYRLAPVDQASPLRSRYNVEETCDG
jgi:hypothetical protein